MSEELKKRVADLLAADDANIVNKISAGKPLSRPERERLEKLARDASHAQASEVPQETPSDAAATFTLTAPESKAAPAQLGRARTAEDAAALIGISRRTFFRWRKYGEDQNDLCPFHEPSKIEDWYERMKSAEVFRNKFPSEVKTGILKALSAAATPAPAASQPPTFNGTSANQVDHGEELGLDFEVKEETKRVADLRIRRDTAYNAKNYEEGDRLARLYSASVDQLSVLIQRAQKIAELEGRLVSVDLIAEEWAPKLATIVAGGMHLFDRINAQLAAAPDLAAKRKIFQNAWRTHCKQLREGRFAPPLDLELLTA